MSNHEDWDSVSVSSCDSDSEHSCEECESRDRKAEAIREGQPIANLALMLVSVAWFTFRCAGALALISVAAKASRKQ